MRGHATDHLIDADPSARPAPAPAAHARPDVPPGPGHAINLQVAFAGHNRANDLGHRTHVTNDLDAAFELIRLTGCGHARLLTGLASGADELAAAAWQRAGLGPIHAVFPFLDDPDAPHVGPSGVAQSATWLDGEATQAEGRNAHLKQTRLIVEIADLLVVAWTGERARGAGGTADAVRCALELGLPVLWIKPSDPGAIRLIRPEDLPSDFDFAEFQEGLQAGHPAHVEVASAENLREALRLDELAARVEADNAPEAPQNLLVRLDSWLHGWLWQTYGTFRRIVGGRVGAIPDAPPVPQDLAEQPGFQLLTAAYLKADLNANRLSAVHRSEQLLLIMAMITAAIVGSSPAVWPQFKLTAVSVELVLGVAALWVWSKAARARQHQRWGEERHLAEQLRQERAGWALGVSVASTRITPASRQDRDLGREARLAAGLPHGKFDAGRIKRWGDWAMHELIDGQSAYHSVISVRDGKIAHRIHVVEDASFLFLLVALGGYLVAYAGLGAFGGHLPKWVSGIVTMAGTIIPAMAAAAMALEAKLEFKEQSKRSERIAAHLDELARRLDRAPSFSRLQGAARAAMQWHIAEASQWREGAERRRLFRP